MSRKIKGMVPPKIQDSKKFDVNRKGMVEAIWQPLYDYQKSSGAGDATDLNAVYTFFALPVGQNDKTFEDTNMESAAALPAPKEMLVTHIEVVFIPGEDPASANGNTNWNDMNNLMKVGFLDFFIGSKSYLKDAPIGKFSNSFRLGGVASTGNVAGSTDNVSYATFTGALYEITPIKIVSNQNFNVTVNFPKGVTVAAGWRMGVILGGFLYRLSQ